jgi:hypothetical protein
MQEYESPRQISSKTDKMQKEKKTQKEEMALRSTGPKN